MLKELQLKTKKLANPAKAKILSGFFKIGVGQYGAGDKFLGIVMPVTRQLAKEFKDLSMSDLQMLIKSEYHEERMLALLILVLQYEKGEAKKQSRIYNFYLKNTRYINNWDLVDLTADHIIGAYLEKKDKSILTKLAKSNSLWERRITMLACFHYIKHGKSEEAFKIINLLLHDEHDLIQKAVGWMLREVGKRCSVNVLEEFLEKHAATMPRTALRYAIEHMSDEKRKYFMQIKKK